MSEKVQPANDAGNDAGDASDADGEAAPLSAENRERLRRTLAARRRQWIRDASARPDVLKLRFERLPKAAQGPSAFSSFSPVEEAIARLIRSLGAALSEVDEHPAILGAIVSRLHRAADLFELSQAPSAFTLERPSPEFVVDLFEAASAVASRIEGGAAQADASVANAVATMRCFDSFLVRSIHNADGRAWVERRDHAAVHARAFERWFREALTAYRSASSQRDRALCMSGGPPRSQCGPWLAVDALRVALRQCEKTGRDAVRSRRLVSLADEIESHTRTPKLLEMFERGADVNEQLEYIAASGRR